MKILLLGKDGMLGCQFEKQLDSVPGVDVFAMGHEDLDITSFRALKKTIDSLRPDLVINCAAYTNVDESEFKKREAFALNADAVKSIAQLCKRYEAMLIHFSTDYVFDGRKEPPDGYSENDISNPLGVYGESKLIGEQFIQKKMVRFFIVRTSWLYGPRPGTDGRLVRKGGNFVDTMCRLGNEVLHGERDELRVVGDQFGSPTYTGDLAEAVIKNFVMPGVGLPEFGVYHLCGDGFCNWHEFAVRIFELSEMKVKAEKIGTADYRTAAQRPGNSILLNTKLPKMRDWDEALAEYLGLPVYKSSI